MRKRFPLPLVGDLAEEGDWVKSYHMISNWYPNNFQIFGIFNTAHVQWRPVHNSICTIISAIMTPYWCNLSSSEVYFDFTAAILTTFNISPLLLVSPKVLYYVPSSHGELKKSSPVYSPNPLSSEGLEFSYLYAPLGCCISNRPMFARMKPSTSASSYWS